MSGNAGGEVHDTGTRVTNTHAHVHTQAHTHVLARYPAPPITSSVKQGWSHCSKECGLICGGFGLFKKTRQHGLLPARLVAPNGKRATVICASFRAGQLCPPPTPSHPAKKKHFPSHLRSRINALFLVQRDSCARFNYYFFLSSFFFSSPSYFPPSLPYFSLSLFLRET